MLSLQQNSLTVLLMKGTANLEGMITIQPLKPTVFIKENLCHCEGSNHPRRK